MIKIAKTVLEYEQLNIPETKFIDLDSFPFLLKDEYQQIFTNKDLHYRFMRETSTGGVCEPRG